MVPGCKAEDELSESGDNALMEEKTTEGVLTPTTRNGHMTAAVLYGSENLKVESVDIPRLAPDEALVRVKVALTCGTDLKVWKRGYHARMITPPAVFGHELAGIIEALGSEVGEPLHIGARVVPSNSAPCGTCLFCRKDRANLCEDLLFNNGAFAEYMRIPGRIVRQNMLVIPDHVSFLDAAMVEPLACVLRGIEETGIQSGDTTVLIGCGPIGLKFIRILAGRGVNVIALGKRPNQIKSAERMGARAAFDVSKLSNPVSVVRQLTSHGRGADSVIEAVGSPRTWEWALQMVRCGGTVNLFGGCPPGAQVRIDPTALHYSEITIKSTFHHTPRFIREALEAIARGEIRASDFVNAEIPLAELPSMFEHMKHRNGEMKVAVIP
jgi:L-iditol 2-dehydrogenase